jgi:uncharacterized protein with von Willebrand factor type A (vWA) domain
MQQIPWLQDKHRLLSHDLKAFVKKASESTEEINVFGTAHFHRTFFKKIVETDFIKTAMELGSMGGCVLAEETAALSPSVSRTLTGVMTALTIIRRYGSTEQKQRFLPGILEKNLNASVMTEVQSGTAFPPIHLKATPIDHHQFSYALYGKNRFSFDSHMVKQYIIFAKTSEKEEDILNHRHLTAFLVNASMSGFDEGGAMGIINLMLTDSSLIGGEGDGWEICMYGLCFGRTLLAASHIGLEKASTRFYAPSALAVMRLNAQRLSVYYAADLWDSGHSVFMDYDADIAHEAEAEARLIAPKGAAPDVIVISDRKVAVISGENLVINMENMAAGSLSMEEDDLTEDEVAEARIQIRKVAQRLVSSLSRKRKQSREKMQIDFRRTQRRSIQSGGIFIDLKYKTRVVKKPRLMMILDTSGSMQIWIKLLVQLIQAVGLELSRREIFIFAADLDYVTKDLSKTWQETVAKLETRRNWGGTTSLHYALETLQKSYHQYYSPQTVVMILSDLFTIEPKKAAAEVKKLHRKTKEVYLFRVVKEDDDDYYDSYVRPFIGSSTAIFDISGIEDMAQAVRNVCLTK